MFTACPVVRVCAVSAALWCCCFDPAACWSQINIPPDPDIPDNGSIGSGTTLNLFAGGEIGDSFDAGAADGTSTNVEVNIMGGFVGNEFAAHSGSEINISGGIIGDDFESNGTSVVNVSGGFIGDRFAANAGSQVNVPGGFIGNDFVATGSDVSISGGEVGNDYLALTDSDLHLSAGMLGFFLNAGLSDGTSTNVDVLVSGGVIGGGIEAYEGSIIEFTGGRITTFSSFGINFNAFSIGHIRGGVVDQAFDTFEDSDVHIYGSDFFLDDDPVAVGAATPITIPDGKILSGILSDGTPFALGTPLQDDTAPDTLTLHSAALPPPGPAKINVPPDAAPLAIRSGQMLTVAAGGLVPKSFRAGPGSMIVVDGGTVEGDLQIRGATVNVSSGRVFSDFVALPGSVVNITGGSIGDFLDVYQSELNISGGSVGIGLGVHPGSVANISGGSIGDFFSAGAGSEVNLSGGLLQGSFGPSSTATVNITGGEFRLDGNLVAGLDNVGDSVVVNLAPGSQLNGVLEDGTPVAFATTNNDFLSGGSVTLQAASLPAIGPANINLPGDALPLGIRQGQTLTVGAGGEVGGFSGANFIAGAGSTVDLQGGIIQSGFKAVGATVNVDSGSISVLFDLFEGGVLNLNGGAVGSRFQAHGGSVVNIAGGEVQSSPFSASMDAFDGSVVNLSSGSIGEAFSLRNSELNITGGSIGTRFFAFGGNGPAAVVNMSGGEFTGTVSFSLGAELNLTGTDFEIDGVDIPGLVFDQPFIVNDRNVTLSGVLTDGSQFSFDLNSQFVSNEDFFDAIDATVRVTLIEPSSLVADLDNDSDVDGPDFLLVQKTNAGLLQPWQTTFGTGVAGGDASAGFSQRVPEPAMPLLAWCVATILLFRRPALNCCVAKALAAHEG